MSHTSRGYMLCGLHQSKPWLPQAAHHTGSSTAALHIGELHICCTACVVSSASSSSPQMQAPSLYYAMLAPQATDALHRGATTTLSCSLKAGGERESLETLDAAEARAVGGSMTGWELRGPQIKPSLAICGLHITS